MTYVCNCTHICMYVHMYVLTFIHTYICTYIHMYIRTYVLLLDNLRIHTYYTWFYCNKSFTIWQKGFPFMKYFKSTYVLHRL